MFNFFKDADIERVAKIIVEEISEFEAFIKSQGSKISLKDFEKKYKSKHNFKYQDNDFVTGEFMPMCKGFYSWNDELIFKIGKKEKNELQESVSYESSRLDRDWNGVSGRGYTVIQNNLSDQSKGKNLYKYLVKNYSFKIREAYL